MCNWVTLGATLAEDWISFIFDSQSKDAKPSVWTVINSGPPHHHKRLVPGSSLPKGKSIWNAVQTNITHHSHGCAGFPCLKYACQLCLRWDPKWTSRVVYAWALSRSWCCRSRLFSSWCWKDPRNSRKIRLRGKEGAQWLRAVLQIGLMTDVFLFAFVGMCRLRYLSWWRSSLTLCTKTVISS